MQGKVRSRHMLQHASVIASTREKPEKRHEGPKSITAKYCRALLSSDKVDVNYIATSTFLSVHRSFFKARDDKSIFGLYNRYMLHRKKMDIVV